VTLMLLQKFVLLKFQLVDSQEDSGDGGLGLAAE
jgi:hypothetical protein